MPVHDLETHLALEGHVTVEDAEQLAQWLSARTAPTLALAGCDHVHAAVLQLMLVWHPAILTWPADPWLAGVLAKVCHAAQEGAAT